MTNAATAGRPNEISSTQSAVGVADVQHTACLVCRAGVILCALPIDQVVEIMRPLPLEQIGGAPEYVRGLSIIRGAPVPVVDPGLIIANKVTQATRLIIVRSATRTIALAAESVTGIIMVAADAFGRLPPLLHEAASDTVAAIAALDGELIVLLRTARLIPEDLLARLESEKPAL